jgi:hypothetical protein
VRTIEQARVPTYGVCPKFGMVVDPVIWILALLEVEPKTLERILDLIEIPSPNSLVRGSKGLFPIVMLRPVPFPPPAR